jgi:hypothetical protein
LNHLTTIIDDIIFKLDGRVWYGARKKVNS